MKPGMQRDILVAYWLLFDEFALDDEGHEAVGNDHGTPQTAAPDDSAQSSTQSTNRTTAPRRTN
jgi:hypothetical protein